MGYEWWKTLSYQKNAQLLLCVFGWGEVILPFSASGNLRQSVAMLARKTSEAMDGIAIITQSIALIVSHP